MKVPEELSGITMVICCCCCVNDLWTEHFKAMERVMNYCLTTRDRGLELRPDAEWNGNLEFKLRILGRSDPDYAKDVETRKSVSGTSTFLCSTPIIQRSTMQKIVCGNYYGSRYDVPKTLL